MLTLFTASFVAQIVFGLLAARASKAGRAMTWEIVARLFAAVFFAITLWHLPAFRRTFEDFGIELPFVTVPLLKLTQLPLGVQIRLVWYLAIALVAEVFIFARLRHSDLSAPKARLISIITSCLTVLISGLIIFALYWPLVRLLNSLS